jgi:hypothetical protein
MVEKKNEKDGKLKGDLRIEILSYYMNHFVINGHGVNLSDTLMDVPRNTCIITITRSGISLKELSKKL